MPRHQYDRDQYGRFSRDDDYRRGYGRSDEQDYRPRYVNDDDRGYSGRYAGHYDDRHDRYDREPRGRFADENDRGWAHRAGGRHEDEDRREGWHFGDDRRGRDYEDRSYSRGRGDYFRNQERGGGWSGEGQDHDRAGHGWDDRRDDDFRRYSAPFMDRDRDYRQGRDDYGRDQGRGDWFSEEDRYSRTGGRGRTQRRDW